MEANGIKYYRSDLSNYNGRVIWRAWDLVGLPLQNKTIVLGLLGRWWCGVVHHCCVVGNIQRWNGMKLSPDPSSVYNILRGRGCKMLIIVDGSPGKEISQWWIHVPVWRSEYSTYCGTCFNIWEVLEEASNRKKKLIGNYVGIEEEYYIYRSIRRGSTTQAINKGVLDMYIATTNIWRNTDIIVWIRSTTNMVEYYSQIKLVFYISQVLLSVLMPWRFIYWSYIIINQVLYPKQ